LSLTKEIKLVFAPSHLACWLVGWFYGVQEEMLLRKSLSSPFPSRGCNSQEEDLSLKKVEYFVFIEYEHQVSNFSAIS
jgi:hypothetical protein